MKKSTKNSLKNLLLWELGLSIFLTISIISCPSKLSFREIMDSDNFGLMMYKIIQLYCVVGMMALIIANPVIRKQTKSIKRNVFVATMKLIHRPYIVWIIRIISIPIFAACAIGIFMSPKPCDTTFIDTPIKVVWGNKGYKRWHRHCLNMHYSIVYAWK
jgi:hypothetical protein